MGFTIDVFLIKQPLGVGASEFAEERRRRAGNEREYAAVAEFLHAGRGRAGRLDHAASVSQVALQCIAHDIVETPPLQRGFGLRAPKQLIRLWVQGATSLAARSESPGQGSTGLIRRTTLLRMAMGKRGGPGRAG